MRFLTRSLIALVLAALTLGLLGFAGQTLVAAFKERAEAGDRPRMQRERAFTAQVIPVVPGEVAPVLSAFGEVRARRTLDLRAPMGGRVQALAEGFEDGATVHAGQVLLHIDPVDATSARDLALSDLARAEAELRDAARARDLAYEDVEASQAQFDLRERALERRRNLVAQGIATEAQLEEAELALASARQALVSRRQAEAQAEARLDQAHTALERQRITLAEAERRLEDTVLHADFTGTLSDVAVLQGGIVSANERLARIIDPDALEVAFRISTAQYLRLLDEDGALIPAPVAVALEVAGVQITTPAVLSRVSATVGDGQSGRLIYAALDAPRGFRPGDFVTVRVTEPALTGVARIPASAVDSAGRVLTLGDGDRLEAAAVEVLRRQGDDVIVRATHLAGREIVREIGPMLGEGILVRPQRPAGHEPTAAAAGTGQEMVTLDPQRRAELIAMVEGNGGMPDAVRARLIAQLEQDQVPAQMLQRLEAGAPRGG